MKYRFAGAQDVPEWVLAEVSVLSKISCVRLKLICRQVINDLAGGELDLEKVTKLIPRDAGFTWSDVKATVAAIRFILASATCYGVDHDVLNGELQQLGLPKENSDGISRPFRLHRARLQAQAAAESLKLPRLVAATCRADAIVATSVAGLLRGAGASTAASASASGAALEPVYHLSLGLSHGLGSQPVRVSATDAEATQLLVAAAGAAGNATGSSAAARAASRQAQMAAALAALDAVPLVPQPPQAATATPTTPAAAPAGGAASSATTTGTGTGALEVRVPVRATVSAALSQDQMLGLLAELRIAKRVVSALNAASAAAKAHASEAAAAAAADAAAAASGGGGAASRARRAGGRRDDDDDDAWAS